jgi:hypothetical protein
VQRALGGRRPPPTTVVVQSAPSAAPPSTVSASLGRILDQLSPTAWLPAALLVGDVALAMAYAHYTGDAGERWASIGELLDTRPLGIILGTLFALAAITILTQSMGFAAIRFLEGYWGVSKVASLAASIGIWRQNRRRARLSKLAEDLEEEAFKASLPLVKRSLKKDPLVVTLLEMQAAGIDTAVVAMFDPSAGRRAADYRAGQEWLQFSPARMAHRISGIDERLQQFPDPERMMPTRLGLALRVAEDSLAGPIQDGELRGYVIRNLARIDPLLLSEHDEHRNRLDMYAVLWAMSLAVIPVNLALLRHEVSALTKAALVFAAVVLAWTSYRGAVSAAEEYGEALKAIDDSVISGRRPSHRPRS